MLEKKANQREQVEFICLENLIPEDHLLRKIENAVEFCIAMAMEEQI